MKLRPTQAHEIEAIRALFAEEVAAGRMLPRAADDIRAHLDDWIVAEADGQIVGCVSLVRFNTSLCEVRSLAVHPAFRGEGLQAAGPRGNRTGGATRDRARAGAYPRGRAV